MLFKNRILLYYKLYTCNYHSFYNHFRCFYHGAPFVQFYQNITGALLDEDNFDTMKKKHKGIESLDHDQLQCTIQILKKFDITALEACKDVHVFCMNPISMDNYGEILKECGFIKILPKHIIRYHTLVRSRTIANLKKEGLLKQNTKLEKQLLEYFPDWPNSHKTIPDFPEESTSILTVRVNVLEKYLTWRLSITKEEFQNYCRNYLPLKHRPMADIQEALNLAQNIIQIDPEVIRRNGFIVSSDPVNSKLILDNVKTLAGLDIKEVIRLEPAILKNNYRALLKIREILEGYRIPDEAQQRCLRIFCMNPTTVQERLTELSKVKEFNILSTNPRVLTLVVHKKKMMERLDKILKKKQCFSLNHLVGSNKIFDDYISNFGDKVCGRDIACLISASLTVSKTNGNGREVTMSKSEISKIILKQLRKHKYWLHCALYIIDENIKYLKQRFKDDVIFNNVQLLLYPGSEIQQYIKYFEDLKNGIQNQETNSSIQSDTCYNNLTCAKFTESQILSLVLYEIEKKYHFSGDGLWSGQEANKLDSTAAL